MLEMTRVLGHLEMHEMGCKTKELGHKRKDLFLRSMKRINWEYRRSGPRSFS